MNIIINIVLMGIMLLIATIIIAVISKIKFNIFFKKCFNSVFEDFNQQLELYKKENENDIIVKKLMGEEVIYTYELYGKKIGRYIYNCFFDEIYPIGFSNCFNECFYKNNINVTMECRVFHERYYKYSKDLVIADITIFL